MILFSRKGVVIGMQPDGTDPANFPSRAAIHYDQVSYVSNAGALAVGDVLPLDALQPDPEALPSLSLLFTVTGGDGKTPPGINLDVPSQGTLNVHCEMQVNGTVIPVTDSWRVPFVGKSGDLYRLIKFKNGVADFKLTTNKEGLFVADVSRFATVTMDGQAYRIDIVGNASFQAYHDAEEIV